MGELLGLPEWLAVSLWVGACLFAWLAVGFARHRRAMKRLAHKRASPSQADFVAMMADEVDDDVARWVWGKACLYYAEHLSPHPDDHLLDEACIDGDDIGMDWPQDFAGTCGLDEKGFPDWPAGWTLTIRNYAPWLQSAKQCECKVQP